MPDDRRSSHFYMVRSCLRATSERKVWIRRAVRTKRTAARPVEASQVPPVGEVKGVLSKVKPAGSPLTFKTGVLVSLEMSSFIRSTKFSRKVLSL
jgi:hypothetical protein